MKFFKKYSGWIVAFVFACAVIFVYKAFDNIANILSGLGTLVGAISPFFAAFIIAYILNMPTKWFNRHFEKIDVKFFRKHSYGLSVAVSFVIALIFVLILIAAILPTLADNIIEIYGNLPNYIASMENYINSLEVLKTLKITGEEGFDIFSVLYGLVAKIDVSEVGKYAEGLASITTGLFDAFIAIIASVYMLLDKDRLSSAIKKIMDMVFKKTVSDRISEHVSKVNEIFINYIYSRLICSVVTGAAAGIVLAILQVKYALLLAIIIALLDMIPYFGSIISTIVSVLVALVANGFWKGVWTAVALLVIQQLDGNVLAPKVMGDSLEIRPFWIIFAVTVGGSLFGFWGMLISVPVIAAVKAVLLEYFGETAKYGGASSSNDDKKPKSENKTPDTQGFDGKMSDNERFGDNKEEAER